MFIYLLSFMIQHCHRHSGLTVHVEFQLIKDDICNTDSMEQDGVNITHCGDKVIE
jgi:hypothetical protein